MISLKFYKTFAFYFGVFLLLDGILSIWFGNACLSECFNNSIGGNIVRVLRSLGGVVLIVLSFTKKCR